MSDNLESILLKAFENLARKDGIAYRDQEQTRANEHRLHMQIAELRKEIDALKTAREDDIKVLEQGRVLLAETALTIMADKRIRNLWKPIVRKIADYFNGNGLIPCPPSTANDRKLYPLSKKFPF